MPSAAGPTGASPAPDGGPDATVLVLPIARSSRSATEQPGSTPAAAVRRRVLGVPLDSLSAADLIGEVERWVDAGERHFAVGVNAHVVNLAAARPSFAAALDRSRLNYADGQSVVVASRLLRHPIPTRLATTDLIHPLAANWAARGFGVYLLGGLPGVARQAAERLQERYPGLRIAGVRDGYFGDEDQADVVDGINRSGARILLVGLGNPKQEEWVDGVLDSLEVNAVLTCGGLFDWVAGRHRPAPRWFGRLGVEWLYRLAIEPRRLFGRYVFGNPRFCLSLMAEMLGRRRRSVVTLPDVGEAA